MLSVSNRGILLIAMSFIFASMLAGLNACGCERSNLQPIPFEELNIAEDSPVAVYYRNADVYAIEDASTSPNVLNESEALAAMSDRGFVDATITTHYDQDGSFIDEIEISDSTTTHPNYTAYYTSKSGDVWTIYLTDGDVMASPITYMSAKGGTEVIVSESAFITSYDGESNRFLSIVPKDGTCEIVTVERIDAATLDELSAERFGVK